MYVNYIIIKCVRIGTIPHTIKHWKWIGTELTSSDEAMKDDFKKGIHALVECLTPVKSSRVYIEFAICGWFPDLPWHQTNDTRTYTIPITNSISQIYYKHHLYVQLSLLWNVAFSEYSIFSEIRFHLWSVVHSQPGSPVVEGRQLIPCSTLVKSNAILIFWPGKDWAEKKSQTVTHQLSSPCRN